MELQRLKYFVAVAEEMHFGRAAERLGMAQPPLSRQIAKLEAELGVALFDRGRGRIRITQAGAALFDSARDILDRVERAYREAKAVGTGGEGRLRIAFVGSATHGPLPKLIRAYRADRPGVDLALSSMNNAELERSLIQGSIDIAIARPGLPGEEFRTAPLHREPLILAAPDQPEWNGSAPIALAALAGETFVLFPRRPRPSFADHVLAVCGQAGFTPARTVLAQDYQTAISLVSVGVGVSLVPTSVSTTQRDGVVYRPYDGPNPGTALSVQARRDNRSPHVLDFFDIVTRFTGAA